MGAFTLTPCPLPLPSTSLRSAQDEGGGENRSREVRQLGARRPFAGMVDPAPRIQSVLRPHPLCPPPPPEKGHLRHGIIGGGGGGFFQEDDGQLRCPPSSWNYSPLSAYATDDDLLVAMRRGGKGG